MASFKFYLNSVDLNLFNLTRDAEPDAKSTAIHLQVD